jgi:hypothetical protein
MNDVYFHWPSVQKMQEVQESTEKVARNRTMTKAMYRRHA